MDLGAYYFSGYDRTFNLYGSNVWQNTEKADNVQIIDSIFLNDSNFNNSLNNFII